MLKKFKVISKILEGVVFVFLLGILVIVLSPLLPIKNVPKTFVVVTGSMEPTIKTGSVVFVKSVDPKTIKKGDIIAFTSPNNPKDTIIHRVDSISSTDPLLFKTKGDANNSIDAWDVMGVGVKGVYFAAIPYLGNIAGFIKQPLGFGLIICLPAFLFIIAQLFNIKKAISQEVDRKVAQTLEKEKSKSKDITIKSIILFIALFSAIISLSTLKAIKASYSDTVTVSGISLSVKDFVPPPMPTLKSPTNDSYKNTNGLVMDWYDVSDFGNMNNPVYYLYQSSFSRDFSSVAYTSDPLSISQISAPGTPDGIYYWRVKACDAVNNCSQWTDPWKVTVDNNPPTSTIAKPYNSDHDHDVNFPIVWFWDGKIEGTAADSLSGIGHVELFIYRQIVDKHWDGNTHTWVDGGNDVPANRVQATGKDNWSYQVDPLYIPFGKFKIVAHAVDKAGNTENSATIEFENSDCQPDVQLNSNNGRASFSATCLSNFSKINYELTYLSDDLEKGLNGSIDLNNQSEISRDNLVLGSCSSLGESCSYDSNVTNLNLKIDLTSSTGQVTTITKQLP
jgi:signal peptidase